MATPDSVLHTRKGCHLCDDAQAELVRHGLAPRVVDIDEDPEWTERYTECVPVVWIEGRERFRGRVNAVLLKRLMPSL
ncbi:MAG: glutaredoxin family protein [Pirellulaceae bacterium]|jgi:glutaredoxin|nr:glutaredoxin family protein [Pirellulaceae bacterium]HJN09954.1 glutaredoxin family protein [Pirellulaceae bacterium]